MSTSPIVGDLKYRPDIDGLRAFAVLSVVLYHAFPNVISGGFVGVDVFFVISGYLISSILFSEFNEHRFSFREFYGRRVRRIFPALAVCLTATLAYGFVSLMPVELANLGKHVFSGASFLSNIALWRESGYFDSAVTQKPLLHLWSLGIEEQFYIGWPALLWLVAFWVKIDFRRLVIVLFLISFAINIALSRINIIADFYLPVSRFWELLAGAALAYLQRTAMPIGARSWLSALGLLTLLLSTTLLSSSMRFPGWLALLPVAGAMSIILAGPHALVNRIVLSNPAAVSIGLISYPLYLWHWPLISFAYVIRGGNAPTPFLSAALVAVSFLLAWATYRFVELPVRFGPNRQRRTIVTAICIAAIGTAGLITWARDGFPERFGGLKVAEAVIDADFLPTKGMDVSKHNHTYLTHIGRGDRKVALAGDSVLFHYGPRIQQLSDDGRLAANVWFVSGGSCAPVPGIIQRDYFSHCANLPSLLTDLVRREGIQSVVLGASWSGYSGEGLSIERNGRQLSLGTLEGQDAYFSNLEDYVHSLQSLGAHVYIVLSTPVHGALSPRAMITRSLTGFSVAPDAGKSVPISGLKGPINSVDDKLRIVSERTGAPLLDPFPDICGTGDECSPFFDDKDPKFSDGQHLRPKFVRYHIRFLDFLLR